jgi:ferredoxin
MNVNFIKATDFNNFVGKMMEARTVVGPVAKKNKFVFSELETVEQLRLDYDVTILPPKKVFFPPKQDILKFHGQKGSSCICPESKVLFGVHPYDIKAIDMTDYLFTENHVDNNYMANREATTVIGSSVQNVSPRAFFGSVGTKVKPKGHDGFLTKITGGYLYETLTVKGRDLLEFGVFEAATDAQQVEAKKVLKDLKEKSPEKLMGSTKDIASKVRRSFNNPIWEKLAEDCFSCGSCNIVCPTCYCFDMQDNWNLDQESGVRTRTWDGCLKTDFAEVTLGEGGACESFRETRGSRFRHRIMRKATYLNEKLNGPACVGCGRCSISCTADIADPVTIINKIMGG